VKNTGTPKLSVKNESFHFDRKPTTSSSSTSKRPRGQNFKVGFGCLEINFFNLL
jgi:hypothetical protein